MTAPASETRFEFANDTTKPHRHKTRRLEASTLLNAITPLVIDLGSTLLFYACFAITNDSRLAAVMGMALALGQIVSAKVRSRPIALLQQASIALVFVVGALTLITNDPRFVLIKTTLVYGIIGGCMLKRNWMARYIPTIAATHLPKRLLGWFEKAWAILLLGTGGLNLALVLAINSGRAAQIMAIWVIASKVALFAIQYVWCRAVARPAIRTQLKRREDYEFDV